MVRTFSALVSFFLSLSALFPPAARNFNPYWVSNASKAELLSPFLDPAPDPDPDPDPDSGPVSAA